MQNLAWLTSTEQTDNETNEKKAEPLTSYWQ